MTENQFTAMYESYADAIFRYCYFRVSDKEQAKDLVQETFTRVWKCVTNGQLIENEKTFLFTIAHNLLIDTYRKKKSFSLDRLLDDGFSPSDRGHAAIEAGAEIEQMYKYLEQLDEKYKQVLLMKFVEDLGPKDIASIIGETENNVSVRINRGMTQLRELLKNGQATT